MPQQQQEPAAPRRGREGGRWINERPTSEEFGRWFGENMKLDPALDAANYVGGVVLIPAVDNKAKYVTGYQHNGRPIIEEGEELSYIPYAKVETRINYFWDLMDVHEDAWVAEVEHVKLDRLPVDIGEAVQVVEEEGKRTETTRPARPDALTTLVHQMPQGYSLLSIPAGQGYSHFLCCTIRVSIYRKGEDGAPVGRPLRTGRGTKQVALLKGGYGNRQPYADDSSMMKAETGALGRALGFAGVFVIPGSGVATAEDMQEQMVGGVVPTSQEPAEPPAEGDTGPAAPEVAPVRTEAERSADDEAKLKAKAIELWRALQEAHPEKAQEFPTWANSRGLRSLNEAQGNVLRGVVRKLEKMTDEADRAAQQGLPIGETDAPSPEPSRQAGSDEPRGGADGEAPVQQDP
jgi:hypothetical protein